MPLQRDQLGRFARGNSGGPGRPKGARNPAYLLMIEDVIGLEDWRNILIKIKELALWGDKDALRFLSAYLLGKPGNADSGPDETDNPNLLSSNLAVSPSQLSSDMIKLIDRQLERQERRADEVAENIANQQSGHKKRR